MITSVINRRYLNVLARARALGDRFRPASALPAPLFVRSGLGGQAELAHQAEFVQASPALHDVAVANPPDVDPAQAHGLARGGHSENLALLRAARGEVLDYQVALCDAEVQVAAPVGEGGPE